MIDLINDTLTDIANKIQLDASYKMIEIVRFSLLREDYKEVTKELFTEAFYNYFEKE